MGFFNVSNFDLMGLDIAFVKISFYFKILDSWRFLTKFIIFANSEF